MTSQSRSRRKEGTQVVAVSRHPIKEWSAHIKAIWLVAPSGSLARLANTCTETNRRRNMKGRRGGGEEAGAEQPQDDGKTERVIRNR